VNIHVSHEFVFPGKTLPTFFTLGGFLIGMGEAMSVEASLDTEVLPTNVTRERLRGLFRREGEGEWLLITVTSLLLLIYSHQFLHPDLDRQFLISVSFPFGVSGLISILRLSLNLQDLSFEKFGLGLAAASASQEGFLDRNRAGMLEESFLIRKLSGTFHATKRIMSMLPVQMELQSFFQWEHLWATRASIFRFDLWRLNFW